MFTKSLSRTMFSGINFSYITDVETVDKCEIDFPGLKMAIDQQLDIELPAVLTITIKSINAKPVKQDLTYADLILMSSFNEVIPQKFSALFDLQSSLESNDDKNELVSELFVVTSRFLLYYFPSGAEIYQTLKGADLSCSILWKMFGFRWTTWNNIISDNNDAPSYVSTLLVALFRLRELPVFYPPFAEEVNKYAYSAKRFDGRISSTFFPKDKIEYSKLQLDKSFQDITFIKESITKLDYPLAADVLDRLTAGISFIDMSSNTTIKMDVLDVMRANVFIRLPSAIEGTDFLSNPFKIAALKAITWSFLLSDNLNRIDMVYLLSAYKIAKHHVYDIGIPRVLEYYRSIDDNSATFNRAIFSTCLMLIWDARGTLDPEFQIS